MSYETDEIPVIDDVFADYYQIFFTVESESNVYLTVYTPTVTIQSKKLEIPTKFKLSDQVEPRSMDATHPYFFLHPEFNNTLSFTIV